ncbi:MAG: GNAT family N-acetyltransferase [Lawsonibacter sp.]|nr:GNAT family N-acetyltransferase [Lawsonibacter sp.]
MEYQIRPLRPEEYPLLEEFLYLAIFVPEGEEPPPRSILAAPELQVYSVGFGAEKGDFALAAETGGRVAGIVWARIMDDYGHVDDDTPSLAISLRREYRGAGMGTAMMREMLALLQRAGYRRASLSVQKANRAANLYRRLGFQILSETETEYIMVSSFLERP